MICWARWIGSRATRRLAGELTAERSAEAAFPIAGHVTWTRRCASAANQRVNPNEAAEGEAGTEKHELD